MNRTHKTPACQNSLCFSLGHDWRTTAVENFRVCAREHCRATERLDEQGTWIDATPTREQQARHRPLVQVTPPLLWEERTLLTLGLHPEQSAIEREAETRYHRLRGR